MVPFFNMRMIDKLINKSKNIQTLDAVAFAVCSIMFSIWVFLLTYRHIYFGYFDWDFALYSQTMWSLTHGMTHTSLFGMNFLANHMQYIAFLIVPIYAVFQHPLTLIIMKLLSFFGGAFILYLISKEKLTSKIALLFMSLYILYPANIFMLFYEFHFENLAIIFLFLLFYFLQKEKFAPFIIIAFLLCLIKENMPLIVIAFGVYSLFSRRRNKLLWGILPIVLGAVIFCITVFVAIPMIKQGMPDNQSAYWLHYSHLGQSPFSVLQTILFKPRVMARFIFTEMNFQYLCDLFGPFFFIAPISAHILFLGLPIFMQHLFSNQLQPHTIYFHYAAIPVCFIFLATVNSLCLLKSRTRVKSIFYYGLIGIIFVLGCINMWKYYPRWSNKIHSWQDRLDFARQRLINKVPSDASVICTFDVIVHLSHRENLYALHNLSLGRNPFSGECPFKVPEHVSYALIDFHDYWINLRQRKDPQALYRIQDFFSTNNWAVNAAYENVILLEKDMKSGERLVAVSEKPFKNVGERIDLLIGDDLKLLAVDTDRNISWDTSLLAFTFYWETLRNENADYSTIFLIKKDSQIIADRFHNIGYFIYPTRCLQETTYLKEDYYLVLPKLEPGRYSIEAVFLNRHEGIIAKIKGAKVNEAGVVTLCTFIVN